MANVSALRRLLRAVKGTVTAVDKADTSKRVEFTKKQIEKRRKNARRRKLADGDEIAMAETGITQEELLEKLDHFREMNIIGLSHNLFNVFGFYKMSDEEAREALYRLKELKEVEKDLRWDYRLLDMGKLTYEDVEERSRRFKELFGLLLTEASKKNIAYKAGYLHPENFSTEQLTELAADMEFTRCILRYGHSRYAEFHFYEKTIPERRKFIADRDRNLLRGVVNTEQSVAILDDKLMTYEHLSEFFGRDFVSIDGEKDYFKFKKFFDENDAGVLKPRFESLGKGIRLIRTSEIENVRSLFLELVDEYRRFLLEGYIHAADEIKALNPDSVNTVRIITYFDGENTSVRSVSMRIGHAGSFVDNAGAGGITVSIDKETGKIDSDGFDEKGFRYEKHPDTGITLKGYQLPAWDKAIAKAKAVSGKIEGARYVGWDFACTDDYDWVLVEGNGRTGFFGAQAPHDTGKRREFLEVIGADPRGAVYDGIAMEMAKRVLAEYDIPTEETMEKLRHFESLGLDGRHFEENRAWELNDEECLARKEEFSAR